MYDHTPLAKSCKRAKEEGEGDDVFFTLPRAVVARFAPRVILKLKCNNEARARARARQSDKASEGIIGRSIDICKCV